MLDSVTKHAIASFSRGKTACKTYRTEAVQDTSVCSEFLICPLLLLLSTINMSDTFSEH